jgi:tetraacyldisaccharide 4'-kinase
MNQIGCPVISVGNITTGGTGKTPMVHFLADTLLKKEYRVAILSRGYKGNNQKNTTSLPLVVSNGIHVLSTQNEAGDEPYLLARKLPRAMVFVDANRVRAGLTAIQRYQANIIILDDGFSHRSLYRDLDLVMLDVLNPFGYDHLIPRGLLREPISALRRADAIILTRTSHNKEYPEIQNILDQYQIKQPVFRFSLRPARLTNLATSKEFLLENAPDKWIACSGIGQPKASSTPCRI